MIRALWYSWAHGAKINFGDLTPYLTYDFNNTIHAVYYRKDINDWTTYRARGPRAQITTTYVCKEDNDTDICIKIMRKTSCYTPLLFDLHRVYN